MWTEFEWENKVAVRTSISGLREYLDHLLGCTNMRCLTPESALEGDCDFLAANLYARSVFGEDALANLSIDKGADGKVGNRTLHQTCAFAVRLAPVNPDTLSCHGADLTPVSSLALSLLPVQVTGHIRIRSKTQGIALSLGDKITLNQKDGAN